jgi:hypothetical protein
VLWYCWKILGDANDTQLRSLRERKCVLNDQAQLRPPETLLINDRPGLAPKFAQYLQHNLIPRREDLWRILHRAGMRLLSEELASVLLPVTHPRPATSFAARLQERRSALGRVLEDLPSDDQGRRPLDRLQQLHLVEADEIRVQQVLRWPNQITLQPETVPAHPVPEEERLYLTPLGDARYWPLVARALLMALAPEGDAIRLAAAVMNVLAADSPAAAHALLDALGIAPLDVAEVTGVSSGTAPDVPPAVSAPRHENPVSPPATSNGTPPAQIRPSETTPPGGLHPPVHQQPDSGREPQEPSPGSRTPDHPARPTGTPRPNGPPVPHTPATDDREPPEVEDEDNEDGEDDSGTNDGPGTGSGERTPRRRRTARQPSTAAPREQARLVSYVIHRPATEPPEGDAEPFEEDDWHGLGHRGVERVCAAERLLHPDWDVRVMPPNHPGYDIEVYQGGVLIRYIEVKSLRDLWGNRGVGMTPRQFSLALQECDRYWLYVVERVETADAPLTRIQNPARRVSRFQFDAGWRAIAVPTAAATA